MTRAHCGVLDDVVRDLKVQRAQNAPTTSSAPRHVDEATRPRPASCNHLAACLCTALIDHLRGSLVVLHAASRHCAPPARCAAAPGPASARSLRSTCRQAVNAWGVVAYVLKVSNGQHSNPQRIVKPSVLHIDRGGFDQVRTSGRELTTGTHKEPMWLRSSTLTAHTQVLWSVYSPRELLSTTWHKQTRIAQALMCTRARSD